MQNFGFVEDIELSLDKSVTEEENVYIYDDAITSVGIGKFHFWHFLVCGMSVMAVIDEIICVGLIMPVAKCDLGFTAYEQGILASAGFLGTVLSSHMWGFLADTWGRHKVLQISAALACIFSIISAFSVSVWMLSAFRFLVGLSISGCQATSYSYLGEFHGPKTRLSYVTYVSTFLAMGIIYLPGLAMGILPLEINVYIFSLRFTSWRLFILLGSIPTLITVVSLPFLPESPKYLLIQGKHDEAMEILQKCFQKNKGKPINEYPAKKVTIVTTVGSLANVKGVKDGLQLIWNQTIPIFYRTRFAMTINLLFQMFMIFFVAHGTYMWIPSLMATMVRKIQPNMTFCESIQTYNMNRTKTNTTLHGSCASTIDLLAFELIIYLGIVSAVTYFVVGTLINLIGKKPLLIFSMVISILAAIATNWTQGLYLNCAVIYITLLITNSGVILTSIAIDFYPTNINAMAICFMMMFGRLGAGIGSIVVGIILNYDCRILFPTLGIYMIVGALLSFFLPVKSPSD